MEEILTSFLVSVVAGVVSYYICKRLDSLNGITHRNEQESPQSCNSEGFHFATWNLTTFLSCYYHMLLPVKSQLKTSQNHISESITYPEMA